MRFALLLVFAIACTHDVHAHYPAPPGAPTGRLVILLSSPASGVTVAVGGVLVVEDARTKKVTIDDIPVGTAEIAMAANGSDKQFRVWIDDTHPTTLPLGVPEPPMGMVKTLIGTLLTIVVYSLVR